MESPIGYADDDFTWPFMLGSRVLSDSTLAYHLEMGLTPLYDAVMVKCKKGAPAEYQGVSA